MIGVEGQAERRRGRRRGRGMIGGTNEGPRWLKRPLSTQKRYRGGGLRCLLVVVLGSTGTEGWFPGLGLFRRWCLARTRGSRSKWSEVSIWMDPPRKGYRRLLWRPRPLPPSHFRPWCIDARLTSTLIRPSQWSTRYCRAQEKLRRNSRELPNFTGRNTRFSVKLFMPETRFQRVCQPEKKEFEVRFSNKPKLSKWQLIEVHKDWKV